MFYRVSNGGSPIFLKEKIIMNKIVRFRPILNGRNIEEVKSYGIL